MSKINISVEIVISSNKKLSSMSLDSRNDIHRILQKRYSDVRITDISTTDSLNALIARKPNLVFLGVKYVPGNLSTVASPVWLSHHLRSAGIACTGSSSSAFILEHNKQLAKQQIRNENLATAESLVIGQGEKFSETEISMSYPIFVKPVDGGGGSGINEHSLVRDFDELVDQVEWLTSRFNTDALLETYLPGREFSVGILRDDSTDIYHAMPLEIIAPVNHTGSRFLSSSVKRHDSEQTLEVTDQKLKDLLSTFALSSFTALGAEDYGRIDIRMDANGKPHFLEANLMPSLLDNYGNLPKACLMNIGLSHEELIYQIAALGQSKYDEETQLDSETNDFQTHGNLQALPI